MFKKISSLSLIMLCITLKVFAQTDFGTTKTFSISASKTAESAEDSGAQAIEVTEEKIEKLQPESTAQLVNTVNAVSISGNGTLGSVQSVTILGAKSRNTQVFINGNSVVSFDNNTFDLSLIPVSAIRNLEVITSGAGKNGQNVAMGGIININTKKAKDKPTTLLTFENGSFMPLSGDWSTLVDSQNIGLTYSNKIGDSSMFASAEFMRASNKYSYKNDQYKDWTQRENADTWSVGAVLNFEGKLGDSSYSSANIIKYQSTGNPGSYKYGLTPDDSMKSLLITTSENIKFNAFDLSFGYTYRPLFDKSVYSGESEYNKHLINVKANSDLQLSDSVSISPYVDVGIGFVKADNYEKTTESRVLPKIGASSSIEHGNLSVYPMAEISYATDIKKFMPGASFGAEYGLPHNWTVFGDISYAGSLPTFDDLYYTSSFYKGNKDLKPETALNCNIGLTYDNTVFTYKGKVFSKRFYNQIVTTGDYTTVKNLNDSRFFGFEQNIALNYEDVFAEFGWLFNKSWDLSNGKTLSDNVQVDYVRLNTFNFLLSYKLGKFTFCTDVKYMGKYQTYGKSHNGVCLWNLSIGYKATDNLDFYIKADNLLNKQYEYTEGYPIPGLKIRIGGSWSII